MNAGILLSLLFGLLDRATAIGELLRLAKSENRDVTDTELDTLVSDDDAARAALREAIEKRRAS